MCELKIHDPIDVEYAKRVHEHFLTSFVISDGTYDEIYYAPNMKAALVLRERDEVPWGCRVFSEQVCALRNGTAIGACLHRHRFRRFHSPGAFGYAYDRWSGSPWSPDSKYLALAQAFGRDYAGCRICILDYATGRSQVLLKSQTGARHHLWSPGGVYSLISGMNRWYLHTQETAQMRVFYEGRTAQRHCYFDGSGEHLILLDDDCMVRVLECSSLSEIAAVSLKGHLRESESVNYSMIDPWENEVLVGVNVGFHLGPTGGRWLAVGLRR